MPPELNPVIRQKLDQYSQRWQGMVLLRGACEGVTALLVSMTVVAILDWRFILPDELRWTLSGVGYAITLGVVWWNCLRLLWRLPDARGLARMIEKAEPSLREDLISAVELGSVANEPHFDSEVFRSMLQNDVAERVEGLRPSTLLPTRLISRWLYAASAVVALCAVLLLIPGSNFGSMMARALAPMANIERVSNTKIEVVEPSPAEFTAARGDNIPVLVRITGPEPSKVTLEVYQHEAKSDRERMIMSLVGKREYSATIPARADSLEYRVRAGDGITRKFNIQTHPRPQVLEFEKTYHQPAYVGAKPETVREESGDLSALEGSEVDLKMRIDQPVKLAELRLDLGTTKQTIPLLAVGESLSARVILNAHGTYQVRLVARDTGFENKFSPQYELRPIPDLVPRVTIDSPQKDVVVSPDDVVQLLGSAIDDVGLRNVSQHIRVNSNPWLTFPLLTNVQKEAAISRKWDLLPLGVNPGDQITTKLVAIDVKGSKAESSPLTLHVSSPSFDAKKLASIKSRRRLQSTLTELRDSATELDKTLSGEALKQIEKGDEQQRKQAVLNASAALDATQQKLAKAEEQLKQSLPLASQGREASDLALVARALSQLENETLTQARTGLEKANLNSQTGKADTATRALQQQGNKASESARTTEQAFRDMLSADEAAVAAANLQYLNREQNRINQLTKDSPAEETQTWERLARQQSGATKESALVEQTLADLGKSAPHGQADRAKRAGQDLQKARLAMEQSLTNGTPSKALAQPSDKMRQAMEQAMNQVAPMERELASHAERSRDQLNRLVNDAPELVERARRDAEELANAEKRLADMQAKKQNADKQAEKVAELQDKLARDWQSASGQLKDRADAEELRRDADSQFVADAAKTAQALSALRASTAGDQQGQQAVEPLKQLEQAVRTVDAGHRLAEAGQSLRQLAEQERWESQGMDANASRPRDWEWLKKSLEQAPNELRKAKLPEEAVRAANDAANGQSANQVREEMNRRQNEGRNPNNPRPPEPIEDKVESVASAVQQARQQAQPQIDAARAVIAQSAPALSKMMEGLARASEQMEQSTRKTAQASAAPQNADPAQTSPPENARAQKADDAQASAKAPTDLLANQQQLNKQVDELKDALRRDANVQDTARLDSRERARDADDAVAMLREPPAKATSALREAVMSPQPAAQKQALSSAATQQKQLADTLKQLAQHYQNLEQGKPEDSRTALRQMEEQLGIKTGLDAAYDRAEQLSELGQKTPQEMLAELERELPKNEIMQRELDNIADKTLDAARSRLENSNRKESNIARQLENLNEAQNRKNDAMNQAGKIAEAAKQLAGQKVPPIRRDASFGQADADKEVQRAEQSLQSAAQKAGSGTEQSIDQAAKQMTEAVKGLEQATADLKATEAKASKARQAAPPADPHAAAAQAAQTQAGQAAQRSGELAQQAKQLADQLNQLANQSGAQMLMAAAQQQPIAENLDQAGADINRAGRHESRLGTPQGKALQQVGQQTQQIAGKQVPQAQSALNQRDNPAAAQQSVQTAQQAMQQQLNELAQAMQMPANKSMSSGAEQPAAQQGEQGAQQGQQGSQPSQQGQQSQPGQKGQQQQQGGQSGSSQSSSSNAGPDESRQMARTLDRLDSALNAASGQKQPGQQQGQQSQQQGQQDAQQAASQAMSQAQQAQQASMRSQRQNGNVPGQQPQGNQPGNGDGAEMVAMDHEPGELPILQKMNAADWAKLPPKLAQGLLEAQREGTSAEYRSMVETYFRVIADRAKSKGQ